MINVSGGWMQCGCGSGDKFGTVEGCGERCSGSVVSFVIMMAEDKAGMIVAGWGLGRRWEGLGGA